MTIHPPLYLVQSCLKSQSVMLNYNILRFFLSTYILPKKQGSLSSRKFCWFVFFFGLCLISLYVYCIWIKVQGNHRAYNRHISRLTITYRCQTDGIREVKRSRLYRKRLTAVGNGGVPRAKWQLRHLCGGVHWGPLPPRQKVLLSERKISTSWVFGKSLPGLCWGCTLPGFW